MENQGSWGGMGDGKSWNSGCRHESKPSALYHGHLLYIMDICSISWRLCSNFVTCYAQATHRYIYSFFPAFRAPSFLYIHTNIHHIIPTAPSGLDTCCLDWKNHSCEIISLRAFIFSNTVSHFGICVSATGISIHSYPVIDWCSL